MVALAVVKVGRGDLALRVVKVGGGYGDFDGSKIWRELWWL